MAEPLPEEPLPDPAAVLAEECRGWLRAAVELRAVPGPPPSAPHTVLYEALVTARARLDRIETLLSMAIGFKAACEAKAKRLEAEADEAWDDQAAREKRYGRREFEGAQERYAYWRLACREQRRRARAARELAEIAADTERRIRLHYYGLDGARQDLNRRLTVLRMEDSMERLSRGDRVQLICFFCHRTIRGAEIGDRYEWRRPVSGDSSPDFVFGKGELPLRQAKGQLTRLSHGRCYHAWRKQQELAAARAADPSSQPRPDTDWRAQTVVDVEELGEGDGSNRGAGAPG